jgi:hypothetical protein
MSSKKKLRKATRKLRKNIDFLRLAKQVRQTNQRALSAEDLRISSLSKSLANALARPGPGARKEAGYLSYELSRAHLSRAHRRGEI